MRHVLFLFYVLLTSIAIPTFMSSCGNPDYPAVLTRADSLCEANPQEAEKLLKAVAKDSVSMSSDARWYYRLLRLKSAYKNYIIPQSNKEAFCVVAHFESGGDNRLLPQAYYYAANVCLDLNDTPQALSFFSKAEELLPEGKDLNMKSRIEYSRGRILDEQSFSDLSIAAYKKSYNYSRALKDTTGMVYCLRDMAYALNGKKQYRESLRYLDKASYYAKQANMGELLISVSWQKAGICAQNKDYDKAWSIVRNLKKAKNGISVSPRSATMAMIFIGKQMYDSAYYYSSRLMDIGDVYGKKAASKNMITIFTKKNADSIVKYADLYKLYDDSVYNIQAQESIAKADALYNYNLREKEISDMKLANATRTVQYVSMITLLLFLLCVGIAILLKNNVKRKKQIGLINKLRKEQYELTEEFRKKNEESIRDFEHQLAELSGQNKELISQLEEQKANLVAKNEYSEKLQLEKSRERAAIASSEIYNRIVDRVMENKKDSRHSRPLSDKDFEELSDKVNEIVKDFKKSLYSIFKMSVMEYNVCLLIRIGMSASEISLLIGRNTSTVSCIRKRLYTKMLGKEGSPSDFDEFVKSM